MNFIRTHKKKVLFGALVLGAMYMHRKKHRRGERKCGVDYPWDTVIVHTWPRQKFIPNIDTPSLKLETYLRVNNIPYQMDEDYERAPDKKDCSIPWIEYNDKKIADSQVIIHHLNGSLNTDLNEQLTSEEKSTSTELQKWLEKQTYWLQYHARWYIFWDDMLVNVYGCPEWINNFIRYPARLYQRKLTKDAGIGDHTDEEVLNMLVSDIRKVSEILGKDVYDLLANSVGPDQTARMRMLVWPHAGRIGPKIPEDGKKFLMGDTITDVDCTAFAVLAQVRWSSPKNCPAHQLLTGGEVQNVVDYMDRIKDTYWSDWEDILKNAKNFPSNCKH